MNAGARFRWMAAVLADAVLSCGQKIVLIRLALHLNTQTGRCDPSIETLAAGTNLSRRAVEAALARGEALDWLSRGIGGGRSHTSRYSLEGHASNTSETLHDDAPLHPKTMNGGAPLSPETVHGDARKGARPCTKPCTAVHPNSKENSKENSRSASRHDGPINGAEKTYAFEGQVIRLLPAQFKTWQEAYRDIPDLTAVLRCADDYYVMNPPRDGKWFFPVSRWLKNENSKAAEKRMIAEQEQNSW